MVAVYPGFKGQQCCVLPRIWSLPTAYVRFLQAWAFQIKVSPQELPGVEYHHSSLDHSYCLCQLVGRLRDVRSV